MVARKEKKDTVYIGAMCTSSKERGPLNTPHHLSHSLVCTPNWGRQREQPFLAGGADPSNDPEKKSCLSGSGEGRSMGAQRGDAKTCSAHSGFSAGGREEEGGKKRWVSVAGRKFTNALNEHCAKCHRISLFLVPESVKARTSW